MKFRLIFYLLFILIFFPQILFSKSSSNIILKIGNEIVTNYEVKNKILTTLVLSGQEQIRIILIVSKKGPWIH